MLLHTDISDRSLRSAIRQEIVLLGGNRRLKIYGLLSCRSGRRMKRENRVFFATRDEAQAAGYRPCGHCLKQEYRVWTYSANQ